MTRILKSLAGLAEATLTIFVTTIEDCVWLVPLVAQAADARIAFVHGAIFVVTFVCLSLAICSTAILLQQGLSSHVARADIILEAVGAILCWILAGFFYYRSWVKKKQRARRRLQEQEELQQADTEYGSLNRDSENGSNKSRHQGSAKVEVTLSLREDSMEQGAGTIQPWTIISLTVAGALDEISYFPGLVVGKIFTPLELCLGTLFASVIMLALVDLLVRRCARCLHVLDRVPLYAVIGFFAVVLTLQVIWDLLI